MQRRWEHLGHQGQLETFQFPATLLPHHATVKPLSKEIPASQKAPYTRVIAAGDGVLVCRVFNQLKTGWATVHPSRSSLVRDGKRMLLCRLRRGDRNDQSGAAHRATRFT